MVGDRSEDTARDLWDALPDEYQDEAIVCTDAWAAYATVVPTDRHAVGDKSDGITDNIERFWCPVRPMCGRFVRKTLSCFKCDRKPPGCPLGLRPPVQCVPAIMPLPTTADARIKLRHLYPVPDKNE